MFFLVDVEDIVKYPNYVLAFCCTLETRIVLTKLFRKPNSILFCRPVDILRGKENNANVEN